MRKRMAGDILLIQQNNLHEILVLTPIHKVLGNPGLFVRVIIYITGWVCQRKNFV
jgi:hypothetical protein